MKVNFRTLAVTSLCILLPAIAGVVLWGQLPEKVPTHFNWHGEADGWSGKIFAVFGLPLFLLTVHLLCAFATAHDPKRENIHGKIFHLILWICPAVSLVSAVLIYPSALGFAIDANFTGMLMTGSLFVIVGNYLPKCRQNYTVGIKLPWTLADEDNWNRTHRLAGPLWAAAGLITILSAFLFPNRLWIMLVSFTAAVIVPTLYSAALYIAKHK